MRILYYYYTLKYLKPVQIRYQLWYRIRKLIRKVFGLQYSLTIEKEGKPLVFIPYIIKGTSYENGKFTFLNSSHGFEQQSIDWNFSNDGKLWVYNLNYFDFLLQENMDANSGLILINDFILKLNNQSIGLEPYPISLRGINWIKFLSKHRHCEDDGGGQSNLMRINESLYAQYQILLDNLEYHLLGNHLLEDAISLLFGAFYFQDQKMYRQADKLITKELNEQILDDGAHFELSTMYHQIILDRVLDCINLLKNNKRFEKQDDLLVFMEQKVQLMLFWLDNMTFSNNETPLLNDAAPGIAPDTRNLIDYAHSLNLELTTLNSQLSTSGYRRFNVRNYECIIDTGQIGPSYQPGHAHADTFNFVLNVNDKPFIVDTGISTYNPGKVRMHERGTAAHNAVTVNDNNSSEVWSSFRVARRARVKIMEENQNKIVASHDGYKRLNTIHERGWDFSESQILIQDSLKGKISEGKAYLWLAPGLMPVKNGNAIKLDDVRIVFDNETQIKVLPSKIPNGYNRFSENFKIEVTFKHHLNTTIIIN